MTTVWDGAGGQRQGFVDRKKTGQVLVRTRPDPGVWKAYDCGSRKLAMSGGLNLEQKIRSHNGFQHVCYVSPGHCSGGADHSIRVGHCN